MIVEIIGDAAKLTLIVAGLYFAVGGYARHRGPAWSDPLERRRFALLVALTLLALAVKVTEDVVGGEAGPIDRAVLLFIRDFIPGALAGFFAGVTQSGSARVLVPLTVIAAIAFVGARRRMDAVLVAVSVSGGASLVYLIKSVISRARPALWQTDGYWGSSFPSGHTLVVAAFATAAALGMGRVWPRARVIVLWLAFVWILLVALSRLVLGVHWPSDVLAAACAGACMALVIDVALEVRGRSSSRRGKKKATDDFS